MPSPSDAAAKPVALASDSARVSARAFALALLVASSLQIMENLLPRFPLFPWMRVGFSYVVILPFLLQYGPRAALALFLARNLIAIMYGGQPFSTFLISSGSGIFTFLGLGYAVRWAYNRGALGVLGASVALATGFNVSQLFLVNTTLIRHAGFYFQAGPILAWSLLSGMAVAFLIKFSEDDLLGLFSRADAMDGAALCANPSASSSSIPSGAARRGAASTTSASGALFIAGLILMGLLFFLDAYYVQLPLLVVLIFEARDRGKALLMSWPFFFYLAWLHLFHTAGEYVLGEWVTREGLHQFAIHALRLGNLILLGRWLSLRFPWRWAESANSPMARTPYLQGFLLAVPLLPNIFGPSMEFGREMLRLIRAGKREGVLTPAFEAWEKRLDPASIGAATSSIGKSQAP